MRKSFRASRQTESRGVLSLSVRDASVDGEGAKPSLDLDLAHDAKARAADEELVEVEDAADDEKFVEASSPLDRPPRESSP